MAGEAFVLLLAIVLEFPSGWARDYTLPDAVPETGAPMCLPSGPAKPACVGQASFIKWANDGLA